MAAFDASAFNTEAFDTDSFDIGAGLARRAINARRRRRTLSMYLRMRRK